MSFTKLILKEEGIDYIFVNRNKKSPFYGRFEKINSD